MTEIEARSKIKYRIEVAREIAGNGVDGKAFEDLEIAIQALKEIREYRELGTIEELQKAKEQYDDIHSVAEKTALCGLCGYATAKEAVITEIKRSLDYSLKEYQLIGTVEELKALKEKNEPKKVVVEHVPKTSWTREVSHYLCPSCRSIFSFGGTTYCSTCGQKLDWK